MNKKELLKVIEEEEYNHDYGGEEDREGILYKGYVDFDRIRKAINKFVISTEDAK